MLVVVGNEAEADKLIKILGADNKIDAKIAGVITANTRSSNSQLEISGDHISLDQ